MESIMAQDYYKTLGVTKDASQDDIAKAYRKAARKYHPDLNPDDAQAKKRFQEIQTAYDTLNDPEKRKLYDQFGEGYEQFKQGNPFGGAGPAGGAGGFDFGDVFGGGGGAGAVDFGEFLRRQFGGGSSSSTRGRRPAATRGEDIAADLEVPIRLMIEGGQCDFRVQRGDRLEDIQVKIPKGIQPGKKIRLRGQGTPAPRGKAGDLILTVLAQPHPALKIVGNNLELKVPITLSEAIRGTKVDVRAPDGEVAITVPPMSSSGKRLRIKGQGMKAADGTAGDMIIELQIKLPERISPELAKEIDGLQSAYPESLRDSMRW